MGSLELRQIGSLTVSVIGVFGADEDGDDVGDDVLPVIY